MTDALRKALQSPTYWFIRLQQAIEAGDLRAAIHATARLKELGVEVRYKRLRPVPPVGPDKVQRGRHGA